MNIEVGNIYKMARELKGLTQEEAAYKLEISVRSVSNYETFDTVPKEIIVDRMIQVYSAPWLAYMYFKYSTFLGRKYLPNIDISDLPKSVLRFQKKFADIKQKTPDMIEIACDGIVDKSEEET